MLSSHPILPELSQPLKKKVWPAFCHVNKCAFFSLAAYQETHESLVREGLMSILPEASPPRSTATAIPSNLGRISSPLSTIALWVVQTEPPVLATCMSLSIHHQYIISVWHLLKECLSSSIRAADIPTMHQG